MNIFRWLANLINDIIFSFYLFVVALFFYSALRDIETMQKIAEILKEEKDILQGKKK